MITPGRSIYGRRATVIVDTLRVSDLRVSFSVEKTIGSKPNKASIRVYNLGPSQRAELTRKGRVKAAIQAGYEGIEFGIFLGELDVVRHELSGPDVITTIEAADGAHAMQTSRVHRSFGPGTSVGSVLGAAAEALGVDPGNSLVAFAGRALGSSGLTSFGAGTVVSGNAARELDRLTQAAGLEWSIQDGRIQVVERGATVQADPRLLAPSSGLVGSPTVGEEGKIKAKAALLPDLEPGRPVRIESAMVSGWYRIESVRYTGDTHGPDWHAEIEGKPRA